MTLLVITTHPVQYHAPVYRMLHSQLGIPTTVVYGSDFSIRGYVDREFGTQFAWDNDLLNGYESVFLSHTQSEEIITDTHLSTDGLEKVLKQIKPQAILLQGYRPGFDRSAFFKAHKYGCPLLFRAEVGDHTHQRHFVKQAVRDFFLRWYYRHFKRLLYIGTQAYHHYERLGVPEKKLVFSPYCVDTQHFQLSDTAHQYQRATVRQQLNLGEKHIVLLMSGKIIQHKRPDMLMAALKTLPSELLCQLVVLFLGDGDMRSSIQSMASQTPGINVCFAGFQNQTQLSPYYHAADILVVPSQSETWGLVVNEALHHGLPCVVSDKVGSAIDLIKPGYNGDIFAVNSVESLTQSLQNTIQLLQEPDIAERCQSMVQSYTVANAAAGIAKAYAAVTHHI